MRKAYRNRLLSEGHKVFNKGVSRIRVRGEHVFERMKQLGMDHVRSIGLKRASQHTVSVIWSSTRTATLS